METHYKSGRKRKFTTVFWDVAQDKRLSLKTRGLYLLMQSLPEDWSYTIRGLAEVAGTGKDQIRSALEELMAVGYLVKEQAHDPGGKFSGNVYILQDEAPSSENPTTVGKTAAPLSGKPATEKPSTDFPTLQEKILQHKISPPYNPPTGEVPPSAPKRKQRREYKAAPDWMPDRFEAFWDFYRTHCNANSSRQRTIQAWDKLRPSPDLIARIGKALQRQLHSREWSQGIGIPHASTYLNDRRWENVEGLPEVEERDAEIPEADERRGRYL